MNINPKIIKDLRKKIADSELRSSQGQNIKKYKLEQDRDILEELKKERIDFITKLVSDLETICLNSSDPEEVKKSYYMAKSKLEDFDINLKKKWLEEQ
jgi:hypothetical protein